MLPLFLDLTDRLAVVVGGGAVGQRKARALLDAGANVRVVALEAPAMVADRLDWRTKPYQPYQLDGAAVVFAAATPEVNHRVVADAKSRNLWVNCAHEPAAGDFFLPSTVRRGDFLLAIGTMGAAPALARKVRQRLEAEFDEAFGTWVKLLGELRPLILAQVNDPARRHELFERLTEWEWLDTLRRDGEDALRCALRDELRAAAGRLLE